MEPIEVRTRVEKIFDLDSKETVEVFKTGTFTPVEDAKQAMERIGHDSKVFLEILNDGLQEHFKRQLKEDSTVGYSSEDEEGTVTAFAGTPISEEKSKQLNANVLNMAKMIFGYAKNMIPGSVDANRKAKAEAKGKAQDMLLSQPAVIEALKS